MNDKPKNPLVESLLAGLAQENANQDAEDERFDHRAANVKAEDQLVPADESGEEEEP